VELTSAVFRWPSPTVGDGAWTGPVLRAMLVGRR
jgi:hypothetical protein